MLKSELATGLEWQDARAGELIARLALKCRYTAGHAKRVAHYASRIALALGLGAAERERVWLAALLHDMGKLEIRDDVLLKGAPLDPQEWREMREHPEKERAAADLSELGEDVLAGMRFHHERWDGEGYPFGLRGDAIPLVARIVAVADAYDAIVSTRPYRRGSDPATAREEIRRGSGTQFDPAVVEAFLREC